MTNKSKSHKMKIHLYMKCIKWQPKKSMFKMMSNFNMESGKECRSTLDFMTPLALELVRLNIKALTFTNWSLNFKWDQVLWKNFNTMMPFLTVSLIGGHMSLIQTLIITLYFMSVLSQQGLKTTTQQRVSILNRHGIWLSSLQLISKRGQL